jgi:hypothetical protein
VFQVCFKALIRSPGARRFFDLVIAQNPKDKPLGRSGNLFKTGPLLSLARTLYNSIFVVRCYVFFSVLSPDAVCA